MTSISTKAKIDSERRYFVGGSDARIIMGDNEEALIRLWKEKRGEIGPQDIVWQPYCPAGSGHRRFEPTLVRGQFGAGPD